MQKSFFLQHRAGQAEYCVICLSLGHRVAYGRMCSDSSGRTSTRCSEQYGSRVEQRYQVLPNLDPRC